MNNNTIKTLRTIIENIVEKEVQKQLPMLLQELLYSDQKSKTSEPVKTKTSLKQLLEDDSEKITESASTPKETRRFSKDPMINKILNETVNDLGSRESGRSPMVGLDGEFSPIGQSLLDEGVIIGQASVLDLKSKNPEINKLFNKDFSAILKKSIQKNK